MENFQQPVSDRDLDEGTVRVRAPPASAQIKPLARSFDFAAPRY